MSNELTVPSKENALEVYQKPNGLDPFLKQIREEIDSFVPDVTTKKGRDAIASIAYKVAKSKTALDDVGKELVAELKELPKKIDAERKRVRETLDAWRDEVRRPLTEWEQAEDDRIANHKNSIENIKTATHEIELIDSTILKARITAIEEIVIDNSFEEFELEAMHAKESSLKKLEKALEEKEQQEKERAELEKLRAEAAAREQKEREERIAREAEEKQKAAIELEKKRVADEVARIEAERINREKDTAHISAINRESMQCFIDGGFTDEQAKLAVSLIAKRLIKNVTINY
jgi:hypothetical protein